jgi:thiol-disulfide isomerase/thioredoxin
VTTAPDGRTARRRVYLVTAVCIAIAAVLAVIVASGSNPAVITGPVNVDNLGDQGPAPPLEAKGWINSPPLTRAGLTGKVVLYDIWTYSCINCVRTFPYVRSWYDRYRADGLVVIGVHSPEFDFEKVHSNVAAATRRLDVTWPVALDDDMTIWNAFDNRYWPADYVADRNGHIRYSHFGEGDYTNTENVLRALLRVAPSSPRAAPVNAETASGEAVNPETYLDTLHADLDVRPRVATYPPVPADFPKGVAVAGTWDAQEEKIVARSPGAQVVLIMHAQSVNLVLASATGKPVDAVVTLDGKPVPPEERGASLHVDARGRTVVTVTAPDMYRLVAAPHVEDHRLAVTATGAGLEAYDFTFG